MNVFNDIGYRTRFRKCWEIIDIWKLKENLAIPVYEHDMDELENYTSALEVRQMIDTIPIPLKIRDELLIIGDICCQNTILLCMFIRHLCDTISHGGQIPADYEITSHDFMWVYPTWPLVNYLRTDTGFSDRGIQYANATTGERWYQFFVDMMHDQQDFTSTHVNKCETVDYWMEVIKI